MKIKQLKDEYAIGRGFEDWHDYLDHCNSHGFCEDEIGYDDLIKFCVKYHVEAALNAAAANGDVKEELGNPYDAESKYYTVDKDSIINAYPLDNIK